MENEKKNICMYFHTNQSAEAYFVAGNAVVT